MDDIDAVIKEFVAETRENLDRLEHDLVELEKSPLAKEHLASIFRAVHSIKGATGFLGFPKLGAVAHVGEGLLSCLRDGTLVINPQITTELLALVDYVRQTLINIERCGLESDADYAVLVERLTHLQRVAPSHKSGAEDDRRADATSTSPGGDRPTAETNGTKFDGSMEGRESSPAGMSAAGNVRVDVRQLDKLMNLVGELVLARNELLQVSATVPNAIPLGTSQRLNSITSELQDEIMKVRMQPIDHLWSKFPRLVRDLALHSNKRVHLELQGRETELDRTLLEAVTDPLTHLIRNAVDHGMEPPDVRVAAGKPPEGHILLRASHEGGQVDIEISDDGVGIDLSQVKRKAVESGAITASEAQRMNDAEATTLVFLPGLSTAENVTSISGRGVGMDVVRTNIEKIGGEVSIESRAGLGTIVKIRIPLTLAIMPALIVRAGSSRYAIPQASVLELVRLDPNAEPRTIERIQDISVFRLRGDLLPLIWLDAEFKVEGSDPPARPQAESLDVIVLQADDRKFGLVVDEVKDTQEIVVKPLGKQLRGIPVFAGATIMGNGEVILILDVLGMALQAHVIRESADVSVVRNSPDGADKAVSERESLLLFVGADDARMAVPLSQVGRLEEFPYPSLEYAGNQQVVQYRGDILPLVDICNLLPERRSLPRTEQTTPEGDRVVKAIVYSDHNLMVGLVVAEITDTIEHDFNDLRPGSRSGVTGTAVIRGRVTEILDLSVLCAGLQPEMIRTPVASEAKTWP